MWLDTLALFVRDANITGLDQKVFVHTIPAGQSPAMMLASPLTGIRVDPELPQYFKGGFQAVVRAKSPALAESIAETVSNTMAMEEVAFSDIHIKYIRPRHLPVVYPRSNGDFYEASVNFDVCFLGLSA